MNCGSNEQRAANRQGVSLGILPEERDRVQETLCMYVCV